MRDANPKRGIAIVGMSCWYPGSRSLREFWENILARRQQFRRLPDARLPIDTYYDADRNAPDRTYGKQAAVIDGFDFDTAANRIPMNTFTSTDIVHWLALEVAEKALFDAGLNIEDLQKKNTGVVLGNTLTGEWTRTNALRLRWPFIEKVMRQNCLVQGIDGEALETLLKSTEESFKSVFPAINEDTLAGSLSNTIAGRICNKFDFKGGGYTVDGACSSSLIAVITAARNLLAGDMDVAFAGGIDVSLDTFELIGFAKTGALTEDVMRVYDKRANGFIPGEGCGFVILKRFEDAIAAGDKIYSVINGFGISSDGKGGLTAPSIDGQANAIRKAYHMAGYGLNQVDFIEGHGTGTTVGDRVEISALAKVLGEDAVNAPIGVTSLKSIVGHTKAAAGIGGLIKCAIALNQRVLPPMAGVERPNDLFSGIASKFYPVANGRQLDVSSVMRAGVSAMGFGGINSHVTLSSFDAPYAHLAPSSEQLLGPVSSHEVLVFSGHSQKSLRESIKAVATYISNISRAELGDLAASLSAQTVSADPFRATLVVETVPQCSDALSKLLSILDKPLKLGEVRREAGHQILVSYQNTMPKVGFVFPGQGSQKIGMGQHLVAMDRETSRVVAAMKGSELAEKRTLADLLTASEHAVNINQTQIAQPSITAVSMLWADALKRWGVIPTMLAGHSLGELSAAYVSGALEFDSCLELATVRGQLMAAPADDAGAMAWLAADRTGTQTLIDQIDGYLTVANCNAPEQTVVAGDRNAIQKILELAVSESFKGGLLPVSNAFHSKYMESAAQTFAETLKTVGFGNAQVPFINRESEVRTAEQWRQYLSGQMISEVDYVTTYRQIAASVDVVLEVGPGRVLTNLSGRIDSATTCLPTEGAPNQWLQICMTLAELFAAGTPVRWQEFYCDRFVRPFVKPETRKFIDNPVERPIEVASIRQEAVEPPVIVSNDRNMVAIDETYVKNIDLSTKNVDLEGRSGTSQARSIDTVYSVVAEMTGFEISSLSEELRLLDDLNMDSIKVTDLMQRLQQQLAFHEEIGGAEYQNMTLGQLADRIDSIRQGGETKPATIAPQTTWIAESSRQSKRANWVRNFTEVYKAAPLSVEMRESVGPIQVVTTNALREFAEKIVDRVNGTLCILDIDSDEAGVTSNELILLIPVTDCLDEMTKYLSLVTGQLQGTETTTWIQFDDGRLAVSASCENRMSIKSMIKSLSMECPNATPRVRSFSRQNSDGNWLLETIIAEHLSSDAAIVAGYGEDKVRHVQSIQLEKPEERTIRQDPKRDSVVLVSGGGKGITAACGLEYAKRFGTKMALLGSSSVDPSHTEHEVNKTLDSYAKAGLVAQYFVCDLTNEQDVKTAVEKIEKDMGAIRTIIHGAGVNRPRPLKNLQWQDARQEISPKVDGMLNLLAACKTEDLQTVIGLTSVIGVLGMHGNGWYAFANETLDLILRRFETANPTVSCQTVAFSVWSEIGMGARMGSDSTLEELGIGSIHPKVGVERFVELAITSGIDQQTIVTSRLGRMDNQSAPHVVTRPYDFASKIIHFQERVEIICKVTLDLETHSYLLDHNYKGSFLMPTVMGLEAMGQAVEVLVGAIPTSFAMTDINLARPIIVGSKGSDLEIFAEVSEADENLIRAGIRSSATGFREDHFAATFDLRGAKKIDLESWPEFDGQLPLRGEKLYEDILFQGEKFQRLGQVGFLESDNETEGRVLLESDYRNYSDEFVTGDPFFRDSLLQSAQIIIPQNQCLPIQIDRIDVANRQAKDGRQKVHTHVLKTGDDVYTANIGVVDTDGSPVEGMSGYRLKFLDKRLDLPKAMDLLVSQGASGTQIKVMPPQETVLANNANQQLLSPYQHVADLLRIDAQPNGPQGQSVFVHRFIPDFKTFSTLGKSVYFSHIFNWMGWARELSSVPVMEEIRELTNSGKWGQVTNWANIEILGECNSEDRVVEARMWCSKLGGPENSSATLSFDWLAVGRDAAPVRIAKGEMGFTWVEILGHGLVKPAPFPEKYGDFVENMMGVNDAEDTYVPAAEPYKNFDLGDVLYDSPTGPNPGIELSAKTFETGLIDSNLVGNLYFGNYSSWMGKIRDEFFYNLAPELYRGLGLAGELSCVDAKIQHLREAMPFDDIFVSMNIRTLHEKGAELAFSFYKKTKQGKLEKLAIGTQRVAWCRRNESGQRHPCRFPNLVMQALLSFTHQESPKLAI